MQFQMNLGKNKIFVVSFESATGVELTNSDEMFEEVRPVLGIPRSCIYPWLYKALGFNYTSGL
jgi:hypothetical protein